MSALDKQIDGNHYTSCKMQPIELAYALGATPCFTKLAKYLVREKGDKLVNVDKAHHCIELEEALRENVWQYLSYNIRGWYWRVFKEDQIHPKIIEFTDNFIIQNTLQHMLTKKYDLAKTGVKLYTDKSKVLGL